MTLRRLAVRLRYRRRHDVADLARRIAARAQPAPIPDDVRLRTSVAETTIAGRRVVRIAPHGPANGPSVVHLHGGAFVHSIQVVHWRVLSQLALDSSASIWVPLYGLAPGSDATAALDLLDAVLDEVQATDGGRTPLLSGDSAGGGLALAQAMRARDRGSRPPGILLFSPWLDLTLPRRVDPSLERRDPMLSMRSLAVCARLWANGRSLTEPEISPLFGTMAGLPPVLTIVGARDVLAEDADRLDAMLRRAGVDSRTAIWKSGFHLFVGATRTPEARQAMQLAASWLRTFGEGAR